MLSPLPRAKRAKNPHEKSHLHHAPTPSDEEASRPSEEHNHHPHHEQDISNVAPTPSFQPEATEGAAPAQPA